MKKSILMAFLVSLFLMPGLVNGQKSSSQSLKNANNVNVQVRNLDSFNAIDVSGGLNVFITPGATQSIEVKTNGTNQDKIITLVKNSKLYVYVDKGIGYVKNTEIYITVVDLQSLEASGACDIKGLKSIYAKNFNLDVSGGSDIEFLLVAENAKFDISGAVDVNIEGSCHTADIKISGASDFNARKFKIEACNLSVSGASDVSLYVTGELAAEISGASDVDYSGNPTITSKQVSGSASLDAQ